MKRGNWGPADWAFEAAGGDPLLALALILDLIVAGRLLAGRSGTVRA